MVKFRKVIRLLHVCLVLAWLCLVLLPLELIITVTMSLVCLAPVKDCFEEVDKGVQFLETLKMGYESLQDAVNELFKGD